MREVRAGKESFVSPLTIMYSLADFLNDYANYEELLEMIGDEPANRLNETNATNFDGE